MDTNIPVANVIPSNNTDLNNTQTFTTTNTRDVSDTTIVHNTGVPTIADLNTKSNSYDNSTSAYNTAYNPMNDNQNNNYYTSNRNILLSQRLNGTDNMIIAWNLSRSIKIFSLIDLFFCTLIGINNVKYIPIIIFPLLGFYGAKKYSIFKLYIYALFIAGLIISKTLLFYYVKLDNYGIFITILSIIIELIIMKILCKFINHINILNSNELHQLKSTDYKPIETYIIWY